MENFYSFIMDNLFLCILSFVASYFFISIYFNDAHSALVIVELPGNNYALIKHEEKGWEVFKEDVDVSGISSQDLIHSLVNESQFNWNKDQISYLGEVFIEEERVVVFLAKVPSLEYLDSKNFENCSIKKYSLTEIKSMILSNKIKDAATLIAFSFKQ